MTFARPAAVLIRLLALVAVAGCQQDCGGDGDDDDEPVEEDFYRGDAGSRDGGDGDGDGDGGSPMDAGARPDGGMQADAGLPSDAGAPDGSAPDGALDSGPQPTDAGPDAEVDAEILCPGTLPEDRRYQVSFDSLPFGAQADWHGLAFIEVTGLTPGQTYSVTLTGASDLQLLTYTGEDFFDTASCVNVPQPGGPARCSVVPAGTNAFIAVDALRDATPFELDMRPLPPNESPDFNNPLEIAASALPAVVTTVPATPSYYEITGLTAGQQYVISTADADERISIALRVEATAPQPSDAQTGLAPQLVATPTSTSLYVVMLGSEDGTSVELSLSTSSYVAQGAVGAPHTVAVTALPLAGQVPASPSSMGPPIERGRSIYAITGVAAGTHVVRMTGEPGIALLVYGDSTEYSQQPDCIGLIPDGASVAECSAHITGSTLNFTAINVGGAGAPLSFELLPAPYTAQGAPLARVEHSIGAGDLAGMVAAGTTSFYRLNGVMPRERYRLSMAGELETALDVSIYEPGHADEPLCYFSTRSSPNTCVVTTDIAQLDVEVIAPPYVAQGRNVGTAFALKAELLPDANGGTAMSPLALSCGSELLHSDVPSGGNAYFQVSDLTPGAFYVVEVLNATGPFDLSVSPHDAWTSVYSCAYAGPVTPGRCKRKPSTEGELFVRVWAAETVEFDLRVTAALPGSEGAASDPIELAYDATPYIGRVGGARPSYYEITGLAPNAQYWIRLVSEEEATVLEQWLEGFGGTPQLQLSNGIGYGTEYTFSSHTTSAFFTVSLLPEDDGVTDFSIEIVPYD